MNYFLLIGCKKHIFLIKGIQNHYENKIFHIFVPNKQALWRKEQYLS